MQYIEAISKQEIKYYSVFLAGGISNCADWQKEAVEALSVFENLTVVNPRRASFDITKKSETKKQIRWEHAYLREVDEVIFWFPEETLCPITLFELGAALERDHVAAIGCHPNYKRIDDVIIQSKLAHFHRPIFKNLNKMMNSLIRDYKKMHVL